MREGVGEGGGGTCGDVGGEVGAGAVLCVGGWTRDRVCVCESERARENDVARV